LALSRSGLGWQQRAGGRNGERRTRFDKASAFHRERIHARDYRRKQSRLRQTSTRSEASPETDQQGRASVFGEPSPGGRFAAAAKTASKAQHKNLVQVIVPALEDV
jgi:hypothetical protein